MLLKFAWRFYTVLPEITTVFGRSSYGAISRSLQLRIDYGMIFFSIFIFRLNFRLPD